MKSDNVCLGTIVEDNEAGNAGEKLVVNRELLKDGHMHVRGRTRSGKTSLSIAPLALQLLKPYTLYLDQHRERDEDQIRMTFQFLLHYEQLKQAAHDEAQSIDMAAAMEQSEVAYFLTPTMGEATTARQIAGLGLYTLINAAMQRSRAGLSPRHCWVFVDEFQELAGRSFASLLAQSSKFGISLIMANQTTTQLENRDVDLAQIVADNCIIKQYFTCTSERDMVDLQLLSKETTDWLGRRSHSIDGKGSVGEQELRVPKLDRDTILETSATHRQSFLVLDDGRGHKEPIRLKSEYAIAADNYRRYKHLPPPRIEIPRNGGRDGLHTAPEPLWKRGRAGKGSVKRQAILKPLLEAKVRAEQLVGNQ